VIVFARGVFRALGLRFAIEGTENLPRAGGVVLASNHLGYLDFAFCGLAARERGRLVRFLCKDSVFDHWLGGPLMRGMHHIPVDRAAGTGAFRDSVRMLRAGEVVGLFPEATISRSFTVKELKNGAVRMAAAAGVPLVPMAVWGSQRVWTKGRSRDWSRGKAITMVVGEPMTPGKRDDHEAATRELARRMSSLLDGLQRGYPDRPSGPEDSWWLPAHLGGTAPTPEEAAALDVRERPGR